MKSLNTLVILTSVISTSVFAGAYVENREAYNLASDQMEFMLRVGYNSDMGAGIMLTNTYTLQRDNELKHGYNEIEGWYPLFKPTDKLTIQPGGLINDKALVPAAPSIWMLTINLPRGLILRYVTDIITIIIVQPI